MAIQDENPKKKLWTSLNQGGFYSKSYEDFETQFSSPEKISALYKSLHDAEYYTNDEAQFTSQFFSPGKQPEVSPIGSETTSQTLGEPMQSTSVPDQLQQAQSGELLGQSLGEISGATLPEGATILEGSEGTAYYDPSKAEDVRHINVLPDATVVGKREDKGIISDLKNSLQSGLTELNSSLASVPEYLYRIGAIPQNLLADAIENNMGEGSADWLRARYENVDNGVYNPLRMISDYAKSQKEQSQEYSQAVTQFEDDILGSIKKGNFGDFGRQVVNSITQSLPAMVSMAVTSGVGAAANAGNIGKNLISALPFAAGSYRDIEENPNMPENMKLIASGFKGLSEVVFEQSFGTQKLIESIANKTMGKEAVKEFVEGYMGKLLSSNGIPAAAFRGAISEGSTELTNNLIAKYSGENPDQDLWQGVADAMIVGGIMDAGISGGGRLSSSLMSKENKTKVSELEQQNRDLRNDLENAENPDIIQQALETNTAEIDAVMTEDALVNQSLPSSIKNDVVNLNTRINAISDEIDSGNISDGSKKALEGQVKELEAERDDLVDNNKTPEQKIKVSSATPDKGIYYRDGEVGEFKTDEGGKVTFETESKVYEIGASDQVSGQDIGMFDIEVEKPIDINIEGNEIVIDGQKYVNNFSNPDAAINRNEDGKIVSINLETEDGKKRTIRGKRADAIAYEYKNLENENNQVASEPVVENVEVAPVGEAIEATQEVVASIEETKVEENENIQENIPVVEEIRQPDQEVVAEPQQVVEPEITVVQPRLKNVIKNIPNQDINSLMGPANVEARRDVIEAITGKRPSKNDAGINNVKSTLDKALGLSGSAANKATQLKDWANYERTEFSNPDEYVRYTAENTTNPDEVLSLYESEPDVDPNDKNIKIAKWLGDGGKVNLKDYREFGDINNLTKDIASRRIDSGDNKRGLTGEIEYAFNESDGITPADVIEFITDYKNESDYIAKNKSANKVLLEDRFRELTGRNITPKVLETYAKRKASAVTDAELVSRDPNMQELGITPEEIASREQMEAEEVKVASKESEVTPKSLLKGITDRLKATGLAKSVKITDSAGVSEALGRSGDVNLQLFDSISKALSFGIFNDTDYVKSISGNITGVKKSVIVDINQERSKIESDAKRKGTWLRAPNGEKSNLTPDQWVTVRTKRFKDWFGNWERGGRDASKIVDRNGEPSVYYNGSKVGFNEYDKKYFYTGEGAMHYGAGFYFTPRLETANSYSRQSVLGEYKSRADKMLSSINTDKIQSYVYKIPMPNNNNLNDVNKAIKNLYAEMDGIIDGVKSRIKKSNDTMDSSILKDINHSLIVARDGISNYVDMQRSLGFTNPQSLVFEIAGILNNSIDMSGTMLSIAPEMGVGMGVVASSFLNVRNPLNWEGSANPGLISKVNSELRKSGFPSIPTSQKTNGSIYEAVAVALNEPMVPNTNFRQYTKTSEFFNSIGIDGVLHTTSTNWTRGMYFDQAAGEVQVIAFEPNQIKSTLNEGTFDQTINDMRFQQGDESINGFVDADGNIVINSDTAGIDTPIHEFAHIWEGIIQKDNPELHAKGIELIQSAEGIPYVDYVKRTQPNLNGVELYQEALVQAIGDNGARLIKTQERSKITEWLKAAWNYIGTLTGISGRTPEEIANMNLREFSEAVAVDLLSGKPFMKAVNGDSIIDLGVDNVSSMNVNQTKISSFMEKMRLKNATKYQGTIPAGQLTDSELLEFIDVIDALEKEGQVNNFSQLLEFANSVGITDIGQIRFAWNAKQRAVGMKQGLIDARTQMELSNQVVEKMSRDEWIELGKNLVDEGYINVDDLVSDLVVTPRALQPYEITALTYKKSLIENEIDELSTKSDNDSQVLLDARIQMLKDMDLISLGSGSQQGMALNLLGMTTDKDYNVVEVLNYMKTKGDVSPEVIARLEALGKELETVKSELRKRTAELKKEKTKEETASINKTSSRKSPVVRITGAAKKDALDVLDGLNIADFGMAGPRFQTNGVVRFSINSNNPVSQAVEGAIAFMKDNISKGNLNLVDAIEQAVSMVNDAVGQGNWNEMRFRSAILNSYIDKGHAPMPKKPYVGTDGKLVVTTNYLKDIVSNYRSANNNQDMSIEQMVQVVSNEVGPSYDEKEIRDAISGYGRSASNTRSDEVKNIQIARSIGKLLSELEDLERLGPNPKSKNDRVVNARIAELRKIIQDLEDSMTSTPEEKAQMKQEKVAQAKINYMNNYIDRINKKIQDKDFEPERKTPVYDFSDDPRIIELEKKKEEIRNKFKAAKYEHEMRNLTTPQKLAYWAEQVFFNLSRGLSAGMDVSSFLIQGGLVAFANPKLAVKALASSIKKAGAIEAYDDYFTTLQRDPLFEVARKAKLNLQLPNFYQNIVEEQIGSGNLITLLWDKGVDAVIKDKDLAQKFKDRFPITAAERQYALYLSDIRFNLFKTAANDAINYQGVDITSKEGQEKLSEIAEAVNDITMASNIKFLEGATKVQKALNLLLFSTRKLAANFKVLYKLPMYSSAYLVNKTARVIGRNDVANDTEFKAMIFQNLYGRYVGAGLGVMASAVLIPTLIANASYNEDDDDIPLLYNPNVLNPIHSDFMKLKIGDTRWSPFLGIEGAVGLIARMATMSYMTSTSDDVKEFGKRSGMTVNKTGKDIALQFIQNKLAPTPSLIAGIYGTEFEQRESSDRVAESFYPMWISGGFEEYEKTDNLQRTLGTTALGLFGANFNTYGGAQFASAQGTKNDEAYDLMRKVGIADYTPDFRNKPVLEDGSLVQELSRKTMKKVYAPAYEKYMTAGVIAKKSILLDSQKTMKAKESQVDNIKKEAYRYAELKTTGYIVDANFRNFTHEGVKYSLTKSQYKEKMKLIDEYLADPNNSGPKERSYLRDDVLEKLDKDGMSRTPEYVKMRTDLELYNTANRWANEELSYNFVKGKYIPTSEYDESKDQ